MCLCCLERGRILSEPSSWRQSLSRSAKFASHDLKGKFDRCNFIVRLYFVHVRMHFPIFASLPLLNINLMRLGAQVGDTFEGTLIRKHTFEASDRRASNR
jgi:hypothetical protein